MPNPNTPIPTVGFISLGCPKATVDTEHILTRLRAEGYDLVATFDEADLIIINTCGFIESAIAESMEAIGDALNENGRVIVTGCLGANADQVLAQYPQVLAVTGPHAYEEVMAAVHEHLPRPHEYFDNLVPPQGLRLTPRHYAYLKISEGCNHSCTFCIIPDLRGPLESRPIDEVMQEAETLANNGVKELLVVAQDTGAYGLDIKYRTGFWNGRPIKSHIQTLAQALGELGIWIRLHYLYPYPSIDDLVPLMAEGLILPYLDIPLQHANPQVLKAMKRPANEENMLARIKQWRETCPEIVIRSTFITGFPGESEAAFEDLLRFTETAQLDRVGCFPYSPVKGAKANTLADAIPEEIREQRAQQLMALQAEISFDKLQQRVGTTTTVLVDGHEDELALARSYAEAPEVDGLIMIENGVELPVGEFAEVEIIRADEHDLWAKIAG